MPFSNLPNELILLVASHLSTPDMLHLALTSCRFPSLLSQALQTSALNPSYSRPALWWAVLTSNRPFAKLLLTQAPNLVVARTPDEYAGPNPGPRDVTWVQRVAIGCEYQSWVQRPREFAFHRSPEAIDDETLDWIMGQRTRLLLKQEGASERAPRWFTNPHDYAIENRHHPLLKLALHVGDTEQRHEASAGGMFKSLYALSHIVRYGDIDQVEITLSYIRETHGENVYKMAVNLAFIEAMGPQNGIRVRGDSTTEIVTYLLSKGADVNIEINLPYLTLDPCARSYKTRSSCLHEAVRHSALEVVELLLKHGADPNSQHATDFTPLMVATNWNRKSAVTYVELLLKYGADIHLATKRGETLLMVASRNGNTSMVAYLLRNGAAADVAACDEQRRTAVHVAAIGVSKSLQTQGRAGMEEVNERYETVIRMLLRAGADSKAVDLDGRTAAELVRMKPPNSSEWAKEVSPAEERIVAMLGKGSGFHPKEYVSRFVGVFGRGRKGNAV